MTHRVLVIDDHPLLRKGIGQLLALQPERGFELAAEAGSGQAGLEAATSLQPDLILLDLEMPEMGGIETLRALREHGVAVPIIILTASARDEDIAESLSLGASGYLLKDMDPERLLESLSRVVDGEIVISPALTKTLCRAMRRYQGNSDITLGRLTAREREILTLLARGFSNKLMARELDITEGTAKVHVRNLLRKMKLRTRVEAAVWAVQNGLG